MLRHGTLTKVCRDKTVRKYVFFLFTTRLSYAEKTVLGKYRLHRDLKIDAHFQVVDVKDEPARGTTFVNRFEIISSVKSFAVLADAPADKKAWLDALEEVTDQLHAAPAPDEQAWQQPLLQCEGDVTRCPLCSAVFTVLKRRKHCRVCGMVTCPACQAGSIAHTTLALASPRRALSPPLSARLDLTPVDGKAPRRTIVPVQTKRGVKAPSKPQERVRACDACVRKSKETGPSGGGALAAGHSAPAMAGSPGVEEKHNMGACAAAATPGPPADPDADMPKSSHEVVDESPGGTPAVLVAGTVTVHSDSSICPADAL